MKKNKKKYLKQGFIQGVISLIFSQIIIKILGLIYKLYLTNKTGFGDEGNAIYSAGFQIYALLLTLSSIGVPNAVSKLVSEKMTKGDVRGANKIFKVALVTFGVIGFVSTMILLTSAKTISKVWLQIPEAEYSLVALAPSIFFVSIAAVIRGYFNGIHVIKVTANSQTCEQLFKTVFTVVFVEMIGISTGLNPGIMSAGANFATTIATLISFTYLYKYYKYRQDGYIYISNSKNKQRDINVIDTLKIVLTTSIPMSLSSILASINKNVDSVTVVRGLKRIISEKEAKIEYGILSGKVDTLVTLPLSFNIAFATALVPEISSLKARNDMEGIKNKISLSLLVTMIIGLPCTIIILIFANPILNLLFPNASEGAQIFRVSAIAIVFTVLEQTVNRCTTGNR